MPPPLFVHVPPPPPPFWNQKKEKKKKGVWFRPVATYPPLISFFGTCASFEAGGGPKKTVCCAPPPLSQIPGSALGIDRSHWWPWISLQHDINRRVINLKSAPNSRSKLEFEIILSKRESNYCPVVLSFNWFSARHFIDTAALDPGVCYPI